MSTRVLLLLAVLAAAAAAFWMRPSPSVAASPATTPVVHWVATAHQLGIVGYRDPAVAVAPGGRLVAYSEGRTLRVLPIGGGVDVATTRGEGQIRHLAWIDDRRVIFEDGGAAARWQMLDFAAGARPLWPTATLTGTGATSGMSLPANSLRQVVASPDGAWIVGMVAGGEGPELWRVRLDGQELWKTPITTGRASWPAWATAREIACVLTGADGGRVSIPCGGAPLTTSPRARHRRQPRVLARRRDDLRAGRQRPRLPGPVADRSRHRRGDAPHRRRPATATGRASPPTAPSSTRPRSTARSWPSWPRAASGR